MRDNMLSFACTGVTKVVWYGDVWFKQRAIIEFLVAEKESVMNIQKWLKNVEFIGVDKSTFSCWISWFTGSEKGQAELIDVYCNGWPMTAVAWTFLQCADELIWNDQWITVTRFETEFTVSGKGLNNVIDALGYSKVCAYWIRHSLVDYNTTVRKEKCSDFLSHYMAVGERSLSHIITDEETLIYHFEPQT
jgi:hypothetical protein